LDFLIEIIFLRERLVYISFFLAFIPSVGSFFLVKKFLRVTASPGKYFFHAQALSAAACPVIVNPPSLASIGGSSSGIGGGGAQGDILEPSARNTNNAAAAAGPVMGGTGHSSASPAVGPDGLGQVKKRTVAMAGLESSPGSVDDVEDNDQREEKKRQPVKRACNECRQQKVRLLLAAAGAVQSPCSPC
jgi:hypothetical protein